MSITVPVILSLVVVPSGKSSSRESQCLIKSPHTIMCLRAAVVWNTSVTDTDFIPGTCVVKPDYCKANDGLGISHSGDSLPLFTEGACAQRRERKKQNERGRPKEEGDGKLNGNYRSYVGKNQMIIITRKECVKSNWRKREKQKRKFDK